MKRAKIHLYSGIRVDMYVKYDITVCLISDQFMNAAQQVTGSKSSPSIMGWRESLQSVDEAGDEEAELLDTSASTVDLEEEANRRKQVSYAAKREVSGAALDTTNTSVALHSTPQRGTWCCTQCRKEAHGAVLDGSALGAIFRFRFPVSDSYVSQLSGFYWYFNRNNARSVQRRPN